MADTPPNIGQVRDWTGVTTVSISDLALQAILDAEVWSQAQVCTVYRWG